MHRTQHRFLTMLAAGTVALSLSAAPALAGSDGCAGGDCQDENTPATVVPVAPTPVAPAPLQAPSPVSESSPAASENGSKPTKKSVKPAVKGVQTKNVSTKNTTVAQTTVPRGSVSAGAGGMAAATPAQGPEGVAFGLAGIALALLAAGGGLVVAGRRSGS